jgi:hypothetical protein
MKNRKVGRGTEKERERSGWEKEIQFDDYNKEEEGEMK